MQSETDSPDAPGGTRRSWVRGVWTWLSSPNRQGTLTFIGTGVAAVVAAIWTGYVYWDEKSSTPTSSVAASVTSGGAAAGSGNVINIGITLEQYEAGLKRREREIRSEPATVGTQDRQRPIQLQKELADVQGKAQNLEASLADYKAKLAQASQALEQRKRDVPLDDLKQAQQALAHGDTAAAEGLFAKSLAADKAQAAESAFQLGQLAYSRIDYGKAYGHYLEAARLQPENPIYLNVAGRIAHDLGSYQMAQGYLEQALAIRGKSLGPDHPDVAQSLNNLAVLYHSQGEYAKAEPLYQRALAITKNSLGPDHPDLAGSLNNLAELCRAQGQYAKAEPLYQQAVAILEKAVGPDHPNVAASLNNLALLFQAQGEYAQAEPLYQQSLAIRRKALGPDHPDVAGSLNNLAALFRAQGQFMKAETLYQQSLAIRKNSIGPDHPDVAQSLHNLAKLYDSQGQYANAEPLYQQALAILEKELPADHPNLAIGMDNYAACLEKLNRNAEAKSWQARAQAIRESRTAGAATAR